MSGSTQQPYYPVRPQPDPQDPNAPYLLQDATPTQQAPAWTQNPGTASDESGALTLEKLLRKLFQIGPATGQEPFTPLNPDGSPTKLGRVMA